MFCFGFFSKLLRVVSSEAFHCARGKKWVTVADLAPLIFHSKDAIHVVSARSLPAPARDKQAGRTSNRLFTPQCYGGWEGWGGSLPPSPMRGGRRAFIHFFFCIFFFFLFFPAPRGGHRMNNLRVINVLCNSSRLDQGHSEESSGNVCGWGWRRFRRSYVLPTLSFRGLTDDFPHRLNPCPRA